MTRILCVSGLILCGCMSTPAPVEIKASGYPGARITLAQMPSTGDVAINLGAIEHVLISRTNSAEPESANLQPSQDETKRVAASTSALSHSRSVPRHDSDAEHRSGAVTWIDLVNADDISASPPQEACPTNQR